MNYKQTTIELFDLQKYAIKLGLDNITTLANHFNNPQKKFPSIHIAGTNGKGSTAFYIAQMLQALGLKVGLSTSPHLKDFRERIRINDDLISEDYIIDFWQQTKKLVHNLKATFFDTTTLLAFKYFSDENIDVAVIETGLGGRLDSTNILQPQSVVLTPVGFDHQKQLGNDLLSIASEKAGIIKKGSTIFVAKQDEKVNQLFLSKADKSNKVLFLNDYIQAEIVERSLTNITFRLNDLGANESQSLKIPTPATYQVENIALAFLVVKKYCQSKHLNFNSQKIKSRLTKISWPGRLQVIQTKPTIILDVSHNFDGIKTTLDSLLKIINPHTTDLLLGIVNDKDAKSICHYLSGNFRKIVVTEPETVRKQDGELLTRLIGEKHQKVKFIKDLRTAYETCKKDLNADDTLIALGSHYLVGSLIKS
ncbi:MAG: bifunctional folylpolyglutamate synthase/dihydrofolate synthase [Calditrichaeota bacterium]|nr:MAG: bifunctional folylpolyglutamate synthase/dihydrofolate synthase [Calditrichota bacterium]MBL1205860.1 bifunctional folylpolyglutamate synthase/dihydrofolate synthase [Calditrichota bacterium]NOG45688.1 bifunctional folylpolyglutamate synthase/dihydrofolate synthase [Calditrichota bacterium]